jgi:hypothetical protein
LIFIISLLILFVSARFLTGAAEKRGHHFGMSSFAIGVFIVGIGIYIGADDTVVNTKWQLSSSSTGHKKPSVKAITRWRRLLIADDKHEGASHG